MAGFRGAQFGITARPANAQEVGQSLMGQQAPMAGGMPAPSMLPTLGMPSLMDTGMHSQASTDAALREADRRLQGSPERNAHSTRNPMIAWQLATLGIPKLELDLDALTSGQRLDDDDEDLD
jgi:hypothetical protein